MHVVIVNGRLRHLLLTLLVVWTGSVSSSSTSSSSPLLFDPISLQSGISKLIASRWEGSRSLAMLEQDVEDTNAHFVATREYTKRRLICLPLDERFNPPMGVFSHNHVQTGDKLSVPRVFWQAIETTKAEVPWLVQISRVEGVTNERVVVVAVDGDENAIDDTTTTTTTSASTVPLMSSSASLDRVVGGPLDFRAPSNYCFLPWWMMRALGLQPRDVVDVELITTVPPGSAAKLRPHSSDFAKDISNPQAVLETELKHYSSLTKGSVIAFDYNGKRYWFDVVELRSAPRGEKCDMIKVQDCDIATDFLPARDTLKGTKKRHSKKTSE
jgi:hypothetical protein